MSKPIASVDSRRRLATRAAATTPPAGPGQQCLSDRGSAPRSVSPPDDCMNRSCELGQGVGQHPQRAAATTG